MKKAGRACVAQSGEEKALGRAYRSLPGPDGCCKEAREGLFTRACVALKV